ncbi:MAG: hypothetical protein CMF18_07660 [Idiomarinaceae bacterium]|nr:hypothetical protein [Idiomarinaceae bacterium]
MNPVHQVLLMVYKAISRPVVALHLMSVTLGGRKVISKRPMLLFKFQIGNKALIKHSGGRI